MNILLDECVPWPMHKLLTGHECTTAQRRGWGGIKNGDWLRLAEVEFTLFITCPAFGAHAQVNSGSNGSDGAFNPTTNTVINRAVI